MTALVSAFARAYHFQNSPVAIFQDPVAEQLLSQAEFAAIAENMAGGIGFFNPDFTGDRERGLLWIVNNVLGPLPLGRSAFTEQALERAVSAGAEQYLILGAGFDSFSYRQPYWAEHLEIFEVDLQLQLAEKQARLRQAALKIPSNVSYVGADFREKNWADALQADRHFTANKISFCSLLGVTWYLEPEEFAGILRCLAALLPQGSSLVFDYPNEHAQGETAGDSAQKQELLVESAGVKKLPAYSYRELESLLSDYGFLIYEHLGPEEMERQYFGTYNAAYPDHPVRALKNADYCLAVLKAASLMTSSTF